MEKPIISFETGRLRVRSICDVDKDYYMDLRIGNSDLKSLYERKEDLRENEWDNELNSKTDISISAFLKSNDMFVACASFRRYQKEAIEFSYDVVEEYRNQGIAKELVKGMLDIARTQLHAKQVIIRVNRDNNASIKIAEQSGAVLTGTEPTWFSKSLKRLMKLVDDKGDPDEDEKAGRREALKMIEEGKDGVLVYKIDI